MPPRNAHDPEGEFRDLLQNPERLLQRGVPAYLAAALPAHLQRIAEHLTELEELYRRQPGSIERAAVYGMVLLETGAALSELTRKQKVAAGKGGALTRKELAEEWRAVAKKKALAHWKLTPDWSASAVASRLLNTSSFQSEGITNPPSLDHLRKYLGTIRPK